MGANATPPQALAGAFPGLAQFGVFGANGAPTPTPGAAPPLLGMPAAAPPMLGMPAAAPPIIGMPPPPEARPADAPPPPAASPPVAAPPPQPAVAVDEMD